MNNLHRANNTRTLVTSDFLLAALVRHGNATDRSAVAIHGDRIIAAGTSAEIETLSGAKRGGLIYKGAVREDDRRGNSNCL